MTYDQPDAQGHFGEFGGVYVPETLITPLQQIESAYQQAKEDPAFVEALNWHFTHYVGRPSPLYHAKRLSKHYGGPSIYFKRDELNHTGAHKVNNCVGQVLLAKRMGKTKLIAETGAGQHGVATATVAALFGLPCTVYMGAKDMERQQPNVFRMRLLGAEVRAVENGNKTLKEAMNEALRAWANTIEDTFYVLGTAAGPHPYPSIVRDLQSVIGHELKTQFAEQHGGLPSALIASIGGGSNAIGMFSAFLDNTEVALYACEAAGKGITTNEHAASITAGKVGVVHGFKSMVLQDDNGQIQEAHSISAGLDYPGIGPEHAYLHSIGRAHYVPIEDNQALDAVERCARLEGIIPALEPAHALAYLETLAHSMRKEQSIVVNICGRGDKDLATIAQALTQRQAQ